MTVRTQIATGQIAAHTHAATDKYRPARRVQARRALTDTLAVALAATYEPVVARTRAGVVRWSGDAAGPCTDWTDGTSRPAADAVLINGVAAHALDYDDVWDVVRGHPSTVLVPALFATGELTRSDGAALLDAYAVALDVARATAGAIDVQDHYLRGWHATATVGVIGATAGVARLLSLSGAQTEHAMGIAASTAAGTRQNFGSMTKPLHAGLAARSALMAGLLAAEGVTADRGALDGPLGYVTLYGAVDTITPDETLDWSRALVADDAAPDPGLNIKRYPCCYNTHRAVEAAIEIHRRGMGPDRITCVEVTVEPSGTAPLRTSPPQTGMEGKFSGEHCVAAALVDGHVDLKSFSDGAVRRPELRELAARVQMSESATPPVGPRQWQDGFAVVRAHLRDGGAVDQRMDAPSGHGRRPLSDGQLAAKVGECLAHVGLDDVSDRLTSALGTFAENGTVSGLGTLLRQAVTAREGQIR